MAPDPCVTDPLTDALDVARNSWDEAHTSLAAVNLFLRRKNLDSKLAHLGIIGRLGQLIELGGQALAATTEPTLANLLQAIGKAVTMICEDLEAAERSQQVEADDAEELRILQERLRVHINRFVVDRRKAKAPFEAFWACTDRLRPRTVKFVLDVHGDVVTPMATGTIHRHYVGTAKVRAVHPITGTYFERFAAWLEDPDLAEDYVGEGTIKATVPAYEMTSARPDMQLRYERPTLTGPAMTFRAGVSWQRCHAGTAELVGGLRLSGDQRLVVAGTATIRGAKHPIRVEEDLARIISMQLAVHVRPNEFLTAPWADAKRVYLWGHQVPQKAPTNTLEVSIAP